MLCSKFGKMLKFGQLILDMSVFIWSMGSPDCKDKKLYGGSPFWQYLIHPLFFGVLGAWMTCQKAEIKKNIWEWVKFV